MVEHDASSTVTYKLKCGPDVTHFVNVIALDENGIPLWSGVDDPATQKLYCPLCDSPRRAEGMIRGLPQIDLVDY